MQEVLDGKLQEFGGEADAYRKKSEDMKMLTALERKGESNEPFTKDDLIFLYEINSPIEGFGYGKDPRIAEFRSRRNPEEDMPFVFECAKEEIARSTEDINENTKAYVGELTSGIFHKLPENVEHIYTSFPEGRIKQFELTLGGKSKEELERELLDGGFKIGDFTKDIFQKMEVSPQKTRRRFIELSVKSMGFESAKRAEIYKRADELGLEIAPAEVGPELRVAYKDQPIGKWIFIGMEPIRRSDGYLNVFDVARYEDGAWLDTYGGRPDGVWRGSDHWVFSRK